MLFNRAKENFLWVSQYSNFAQSKCRTTRRGNHRKYYDVALLGGRGYHSSYGGVENAVREISNKLASQYRLRVLVYGSNPSDFNELDFSNSKLSFVYPPKPIYRYLGQHGAVFFCVLHMLCISRPKVALVFASGPNFFTPLIRLFRISVISSLRAVDSARDKWGFVSRTILRLGEFFAWRLANSFTANSLEMVRIFSSKRSDVVFVPNGSIAAKNNSSTLLADHALQENQFLLFAARLDPVKRLHLLLQAHLQLDESERLPLVIAGGHSKSATYQEHLKSYAASDVIFLGHISATELAPLMAQCRAFLLPSVLEGMSNSLLTAMASGRAVLASDIAPNADVLCTQEALFKADDIDDLRVAMRRLCRDPLFAQHLGARLQQRACENFTWDKTAGVFYQQLLPFLTVTNLDSIRKRSKLT